MRLSSARWYRPDSMHPRRSLPGSHASSGGRSGGPISPTMAKPRSRAVPCSLIAVRPGWASTQPFLPIEGRARRLPFCLTGSPTVTRPASRGFTGETDRPAGRHEASRSSYRNFLRSGSALPIPGTTTARHRPCRTSCRLRRRSRVGRVSAQVGTRDVPATAGESAPDPFGTPGSDLPFDSAFHNAPFCETRRDRIGAWGCSKLRLTCHEGIFVMSEETGIGVDRRDS